MDLIKVFCSKNNKFLNDNVSILVIGSSENRNRIINDDYLDMPQLINSDGSIYDDKIEPSDFDISKNIIFKKISEITNINDIDNFKYLTVDPTYDNTLRNINIKDNVNYKGHISSMFHQINDDKINDCNVICVVGCYKDFFDETNILKISNILEKNGGYLLICDTVIYNIDKLFIKKFNNYLQRSCY